MIKSTCQWASNHRAKKKSNEERKRNRIPTHDNNHNKKKGNINNSKGVFFPPSSFWRILNRCQVSLAFSLFVFPRSTGCITHVAGSRWMYRDFRGGARIRIVNQTVMTWFYHLTARVDCRWRPLQCKWAIPFYTWEPAISSPMTSLSSSETIKRRSCCNLKTNCPDPFG